MQARRSELVGDERHLVKRLVRQGLEPEASTLAALPEGRRSFVGCGGVGAL